MKNNFLSTSEMLRLQGICPASVTVPPTISKRKVGFMIGNAFTQTVFERLFVAALRSSGLAKIDDPHV